MDSCKKLQKWNLRDEEQSSFADVVFEFDDGTKLHTSKAIISCHSSVFQDLFTFLPEESLVPLHDKDPDHLEEFFLMMYPPCATWINKDNLDYILPLCDEYDTPYLKQKCEAYLLAALETGKVEIDYVLDLVDKYHCKQLIKDECETRMKNNPSLDFALLAQKHELSSKLINICTEHIARNLETYKSDNKLAMLNREILHGVLLKRLDFDQQQVSTTRRRTRSTYEPFDFLANDMPSLEQFARRSITGNNSNSRSSGLLRRGVTYHR